MSVVARLPAGARGRWAVLLAAGAGWVGLFWLNGRLWDGLLYGLVGLDPAARTTQTLHFFLYDTVKITLLLVGIIFAVSVLRSFMSVERTRALLGGRREGLGNVLAAGLGVITPFCSCSAVPAFIGFVAAGVPIGVTLSFLIASPLTLPKTRPTGRPLRREGVQPTARPRPTVGWPGRGTARLPQWLAALRRVPELLLGR